MFRHFLQLLIKDSRFSMLVIDEIHLAIEQALHFRSEWCVCSEELFVQLRINSGCSSQYEHSHANYV